jgi:quercetin dioxygenase-like cupin family protein
VVSTLWCTTGPDILPSRSSIGRSGRRSEHDQNSETVPMRRHQAVVVASFLAIAVSVAPQAAGAQSAAPANPPALKWGPAPAVFEPGAQMAVLQGDPGKAGEEFTVRLRLPNGYKIAPHTHPTAENITVIEGTFLVGMGSTVNHAKMLTLPRGAFASAPAQHPHYAEARGATVVQVHAIGPFALTYVNPADAPVAIRSHR